MIFEVYPSRRGLMRRKQWSWRLKANNGRIVADSGESYNNKRDCLVMAQTIRNEVAGAPIKEIER